MILSHQHRFIFVALPKTGTTSIESALRPHLGPDDVFLSMPKDGRHLGAQAIRERFGEDVWREYATFAFVRNPYSLVHSWYRYLHRLTLRYCVAERGPIEGLRWYRKRSAARETFTEFVHSGTRWTQTQLSRLCDDDGTLLVDFVGRYENLKSDFAKLCQRVGLACELPHLNASRTASSFGGAYDDDLRERVYGHFEEEFERFGYARVPGLEASAVVPTDAEPLHDRRTS